MDNGDKTGIKRKREISLSEEDNKNSSNDRSSSLNDDSPQQNSKRYLSSLSGEEKRVGTFPFYQIVWSYIPGTLDAETVINALKEREPNLILDRVKFTPTSRSFTIYVKTLENWTNLLALPIIRTNFGKERTVFYPIRSLADTNDKRYQKILIKNIPRNATNDGIKATINALFGEPPIHWGIMKHPKTGANKPIAVAFIDPKIAQQINGLKLHSGENKLMEFVIPTPRNRSGVRL